MSFRNACFAPGLWAFLLTAPCPAEDFAIRDGDTVVFLGDSITAARTYGKLIENYTLLRFPERKVRFINGGQGGDTAAGGLARLERDVFDRGATVLTVAYGVNDIGWGLRADAEHRQKYLDAIEAIVKRCHERGVRVYVCSAAITAADPDKSETDFLQTMCDEGMELSRRHGGHAIDVQRGMRAIQRRVRAAAGKAEDPSKRETMHAADGVHLNDLGQVAMAFAILKGLGAPADVSSATIDAQDLTLLAADGCRVSDIAGMAERLEFTRLDEGLPLNAETFFGLHFRFVPIPNELNRYLLAIKSLPPGRFNVSADDRRIGTWTDRQLAAGVHISSVTPDPWLPGGPWSAQANILHALTEARDKLDVTRLLAGHHLAGQELPGQLAPQVGATNESLEEMQRLVARPRPYRFVVARSADGEKE
jgi:lysophospholipase L1-like esterase